MDATQAARAYQSAVVNAAQYEEAARWAATTANQARAALEAIDPTHSLLQLSPEDMLQSIGMLQLSPFQALVELFLKPEPAKLSRGNIAPETAMLASSVAISQFGAEPSKVLKLIERTLPGLSRGRVL